MLTMVHCKRRTSSQTSCNGCPKLFSISDNVSVVMHGVLIQILDSFNKSYSSSISRFMILILLQRNFLRLVVCRKRDAALRPLKCCTKTPCMTPETLSLMGNGLGHPLLDVRVDVRRLQ